MIQFPGSIFQNNTKLLTSKELKPTTWNAGDTRKAKKVEGERYIYIRAVFHK